MLPNIPGCTRHVDNGEFGVDEMGGTCESKSENLEEHQETSTVHSNVKSRKRERQ